MTVDSVTKEMKEASVAMETADQGVLSPIAVVGKPGPGFKPADPVSFSAFLRSGDSSDDPLGLSIGFRGGGKKRSGTKIVHNQVLRIRKEDNRLGEDVGEGLSAREKVAFVQVSPRMGVLFYARPSLPSPLGIKASID